MGRSRRRQPRAAPKAPAGPAPREIRRTLALHLVAALVIAVVVLGATVLLAGALAPWVVLAFAVGAALALRAWVTGRLEGAALSDEDRILQTMAAGLTLLAAGFALIAAILLTVT